MPKSTLIAILVVITSTTLVLWAFLGLKQTTPAKTPQINNKSTSVNNVLPKDTISLPISIANKAVATAKLVYNLEGTITTIKNNSNGLELVTDITGTTLPKFVVTKSTKVYITKNDKKTPAASTDIKPNQKVNLSISYGLRSKTWTLTEVNIILSKVTPELSVTPSVTPSSN